MKVKRRSFLCAAISFLLLSVLNVPRLTAGDIRSLNESAAELMRRGEYENALEQLLKTFDLFPYDESVRRNLIAAYAAVGKHQIERKQFDEAAESFDSARKLAPENPDFGILRGIALYLGKRYDEAAVELEQARRERENNAVLLYYLGRVYYDTGNLPRAIEILDQALALDPKNKAISEITAKAHRESAVESRMEKGYSSMFTISYDEGTRPDLADAVLDTLETAYNRVGSDLSYYPTARVPVILYTRKDYRSITAGPEWSGGLFDGKVRLPVGGAKEISPVLRGVLFHEYTHVVVGELTRGNCPVWLNEGLAEVEGRKEYDTPTPELDNAAKTGDFLPFSTLEKTMTSLDAKSAALAYQQSYSLVSFMITAYGQYKIRDILVNIGKGMEFKAAIDAAFSDYGLDFKGIVREWNDSMAKKYGAKHDPP